MDMEQFHAVRAMHRYGGSFAKALAQAFIVADVQNYARLKAAFPEIFAHYLKMSKRLPKTDPASLP